MTTKKSNALRDMAASYDIEISDGMLDKFDIYMDMIIEWNGKMNLTAITEPEEIIERHFLDSVLVLLSGVITDSASLLDVGAGAGFPSIPLKILKESLIITQLDSLEKRLGFLSEVSERFCMGNIRIHGRAEDMAKKEGLRESFDIVTARAVASLPELCELCLPFVKPGGYFIAMKGPDAENEISSAGNAIAVLGGRLEDTIHSYLPSGHIRNLIVIEKISQTSILYPRSPVKIRKAPL